MALECHECGDIGPHPKFVVEGNDLVLRHFCLEHHPETSV